MNTEELLYQMIAEKRAALNSLSREMGKLQIAANQFRSEIWDLLEQLEDLEDDEDRRA